MNMSVDYLKSLLSQRDGIARTNLFRVKLPSLPGASSEEMNILCKDVQMPGRQIMSNNRQIGQQLAKVPYGYAVSDVSMTFHVLNDYGVKEYFQTWQDLAINQNTLEVGYQKGQGGYAYDVQIEQLKKINKVPKYLTPKKFNQSGIGSILPRLTDIDILQGFYDVASELNDMVVYKCTLIDAYPTSITAINLNNEMDGIVELNVQLSYTNWKANEFISPTNIKQAVKQSIGTILGVYNI
jgi:hypothetical protein